MVDTNGTPPAPPPQGPQQVIPRVVLIYKQLENGARQIRGIDIAGARFGGIVAVDTRADTTRPSTLPPDVVRLNLETLWPFEWVDEAQAQPIVIAGARDMPPEPGQRGPRIVR